MKITRIFNLDHTKRVRSAIRNQHAETYILITLLSFAASVSLTRLFLYLTGYPQIGNGELHIAHVLWGGLLLFAASLVLLIFANQWAYDLASVLSGAGVGLFIDEVGKFITHDNNYFYPSAAPIIYAFFLLTLLLFTRVRRPNRTDSRSNFYYVLDTLEEMADRDLNEDELNEIRRQLDAVIDQNSDPFLKPFAQNLQNYLVSSNLFIAPPKMGLIKKIRLKLDVFEKKHLSRKRSRYLICFGLLGLSIWGLLFPVIFLSNLHDPREFHSLLMDLVNNRLVRNASGLNWFEARIGMEGTIGILLFISSLLLFLGKDKRAISLAYVSLLFSLTIVNLLVFYFDQFSSIVITLVEFLILILILRYRKRFDPN